MKKTRRTTMGNLLSRSLKVLLLSCLVPCPAFAATPDPTKPPKKSASLKQTDCSVVATEAKRIVPGFTIAGPYSKELWERVSEDVNPCKLGICLFTLLNVSAGRDALHDARAPSGPGWIPDYIDSLDPVANQRHHFGFHFYVGVGGGFQGLVATVGAQINIFDDSQTNNVGDLRLSGAAETLGGLSTGTGQLPLVSGRVKNGFCAR